MKITIENTDRLLMVNGVPGRIWEGTTESGIAVYCLITRIAVRKEDDCAQFDRELLEQPVPASVDAVRAFPLNLVL